MDRNQSYPENIIVYSREVSSPSLESLSLEEFIAHPSIVPFQAVYDDNFKKFIRDNPYVRMGTIIANTYVIAYTEQIRLTDVIRQLGQSFIDTHITAFTILDEKSLDPSGVTDVHQIPTMNLKGEGTLLGFVDTGIDYTSPAFQYEDGTSKIVSIWDQTIQGNAPENMHFGSVYTRDQINLALQSSDPFSVVPQRDMEGHGTFIASVAGGRPYEDRGGVAPDAEIVAVKLKPISPFYLATTSTPPGNKNVFGSSEIMMGIQFILDKAAELNRPVAICIALGSNFGSHSGFSLMEEFISLASSRKGVVICMAAGNECNAKHHTYGTLERSQDTHSLDIRVEEGVGSISVYVWSEPWDKISVSVQSPSGEMVQNIPFENNTLYEKALILEKSIITISYFEARNRAALVRVTHPAAGIWKVILLGEKIISGKFHAWLPITGMISEGVDFLEPDPNYTIVVPATALGGITCGAYNSNDNSLYPRSSWGPTALPWMSPDLVAPGVNIKGMYPSGPGVMSGTSASVAYTTGASAILLQWGIVEGNDTDMNCGSVRAVLIAGCKRDGSREYPNVLWGYGKLNLLNSFEFLK